MCSTTALEGPTAPIRSLIDRVAGTNPQALARGSIIAALAFGALLSTGHALAATPIAEFRSLPDQRAAYAARHAPRMQRLAGPIKTTALLTSSPRKRGGGFTFEVQQVTGEYLGRGFEAKALSWRVVAAQGDVVDLLWGALAEVCFAREEATKASVGVFDAALLPWAMGVAEVGIDAEGMAEFVMVGELGAIVLGKGLAELLGEAGEPGVQLPVGWFGAAVGWLIEKDEAGVAFLGDQDGLAVFAEQDVVGFPVSWLTASIDMAGALADRHTIFDMLDGRAAFTPAIATLEFGTRQKVAPVVVLGTADLGVDKAIDGFMADRGWGALLTEPSGDLLGGPTAGETAEDHVAQLRVAFEP